MAEASRDLEGPDFEKGCDIDEVPDGGMLLGHAFDEAILVARQGPQLFAIGATCTHYGGPLAKGLMVDCTVRCPWHHARFDLRTGEAIAAPALNDVSCWKIEKRGEHFFVTGKIDKNTARQPKSSPASVVIVGAGAAGSAAAEMLRREGYGGPVTLIGADEFLPYDRPNLSKDYLAGIAPEEWIPLRSAEFYREQKIDTLIKTSVQAIDPKTKQVTVSDGRSLGYGALLLATGADPVRLAIPGNDLSHVCYLRTLAESRRIIDKAKDAKRAVVIGASFIGLEVAASLRERKVEVAVVGIGVRPNTALAGKAGIATDHGVLVNEYLETSIPGIFAAGDIARWPDARTGRKIRVEHWVVAQRQGQTAARNILGAHERFVAPPFFWSNHFDLHIRYVGHGSGDDQVSVSGDLKAKDASVIFRAGGRVTAVASIGRDRENLEADVALERSDGFRAL